VAHQSFRGVRRFRLTPFLLLVAYRLRIFDHLSEPVYCLTVCTGKKRMRSHFSPSRDYPPGNDFLCSMLLRAESSGKEKPGWRGERGARGRDSIIFNLSAYLFSPKETTGGGGKTRRGSSPPFGTISDGGNSAVEVHTDCKPRANGCPFEMLQESAAATGCKIAAPRARVLGITS